MTDSDITVTLFRTTADGDEIDIEVTGDYKAGTDDVHYLRNGDPGYPGNPPEVAITSATDADGNDVELTEEETEEAILAIIEKICVY